MDYQLQETQRLQFKLEVLRARLQIRDFFLRTSIRDVYENIGQVLSLVRMQLSLLDGDTSRDGDVNIHSSGTLVGQSIKDLRAMSKSFYPDTDILQEQGFIEGCKSSIRILFKDDKPLVKIKGHLVEIEPNLKLVLFRIVQEILIAIKEFKERFISMAITHTSHTVQFAFNYEVHNSIKTNEINGGEHEQELSFLERLKLINASINLTHPKTGIEQIKLISPIKMYLHAEAD